MSKAKKRLSIIEFNAGRSDALHGREMQPTTLAYAKGYAAGMKVAKKRDDSEFRRGYKHGVNGGPVRPTSDQYVAGYHHGRNLAQVTSGR